MMDAVGRFLLWAGMWILLILVLIGVGISALAVNVYDRWRYS